MISGDSKARFRLYFLGILLDPPYVLVTTFTFPNHFLGLLHPEDKQNSEKGKEGNETCLGDPMCGRQGRRRANP
jgi:hypothetical protein